MSDRVGKLTRQDLVAVVPEFYERFRQLAEEAGYGKYLASHADAWRQSCADLIEGLADVLIKGRTCGLIRADRTAAGDPADALGRSLVAVYRRHGLGFEHFLGLIKLLRIALDEALDRAGAPSPDPAACRHFADSFEFGAVTEWHRQEAVDCQRELRAARHYILYEKRRYYTIFHRMVEPAFVVDHQMRILDVNPAFEDFFRVNGREQVGRSCCDVIGASLCKACALEKSLAQRSSFANIEAVVQVQGEQKFVLMAGTSLGEINDEEPRSLIILQDITEKKKIEQALRKSEEKYRSLVENVPDVTWRADEEGRVLFISPNVTKICGYTHGEMMAAHRFAFVHPDDLPAVQAAYDRLFAAGDKFEVRYRFRCPSGNEIWLFDRADAVYEKDGQRYADGVFSDVTELKQVEDELARHQHHLTELVEERTAELKCSNERLRHEISERQVVEEELRRLAINLKRSNTELKQFAHVVSHDIREPLLLIVAFGERLISRCGDQLDDRGRGYLERILKSSRKLDRMVSELLKLATITSRGLEIEPLNLSEVLHEVIEDLEERIQQVHARIEIGELHTLDGDRVLVRQLFQNVIANALKYRREEIDPVVVVQSRIVGSDICEITIEDNGIGFDERYLDRIFIPFERLAGGEKYEGTGIGLATCEKIVVHHGGDITARSTPGIGTTFIIRLPVRQTGGRGKGGGQGR